MTKEEKQNNKENHVYGVYDRVWVLENKSIKEKIIYSVTERMNFKKDGIHIEYAVVNDLDNASPEIAQDYPGSLVFKSMSDLVDTFI